MAVGNVFIIFNPWFSSIWHLAVRKEFRGIGIGERLMHAAEESIRDHGCNYSSLFVKSSEGSLVEYYGTQGYALWGESILNLNKKLV
ncbi:TPA: GNAT family N-acetyltransferase [Candidatus Woesearchaeota archaeon]|nr:GNAT family N-acetyltransferase [Candidatus Woesearchaeota archaeon]